MTMNQFFQKGFDLSGSFKVGEYNNLVSDSWKIEDYGNPKNLCLVLGSSACIWQPFKEWIGAIIREDKDIPEHSLDEYCRNAIFDVLSSEDVDSVRIYFGSNPAEQCHLQTAGHLAGIACYEPSILRSVHSTFGLWFSFRAVVVFKNQIGLDSLPITPPAILTEETKLAMKAFAENNPADWWRNASLDRQYRNLVKCGTDVEYSEEQLGYHCANTAGTTKRNEYLCQLFT